MFPEPVPDFLDKREPVRKILVPSSTIGVFHNFFLARKADAENYRTLHLLQEAMQCLIVVFRKLTIYPIQVSSAECMSVLTDAFATLAMTAALPVTIVKFFRRLMRAVWYFCSSENSNVSLMFVALAISVPSTNSIVLFLTSNMGFSCPHFCVINM